MSGAGSEVDIEGCDAIVVNLAWAAGFFDGEGCTTSYLKNGRYVIQLQINQINLEPLERFQGAVGAGRIYGPYEVKNAKPQWVYKATGEAVVAILDLLDPYLTSIKREQGAIAIEKRNSTRYERPTPEQIKDRIRAYNREWYRRNKKRVSARG